MRQQTDRVKTVPTIPVSEIWIRSLIQADQTEKPDFALERKTLDRNSGFLHKQRIFASETREGENQGKEGGSWRTSQLHSKEPESNQRRLLKYLIKLVCIANFLSAH